MGASCLLSYLVHGNYSHDKCALSSGLGGHLERLLLALMEPTGNPKVAGAASRTPKRVQASLTHPAQPFG